MTMYANPRKTRSVKFLGPVELGTLVDDVLAIPEEIWDIENAGKPNQFAALDQTKHIIFRFVNHLDDWRESHNRSLWSDWQDRLLPILQQATKPYGYSNGSFPRIMLARMAPGGVIHPHRDAMPSAKWPHKIHVPLTTNDGVRFFVDPQTYQFKVGEAVEVNNLDVHAVVNEGKTHRIHLIFEYFDRDQPSWLDNPPA
ncbi:MAG TPA: aspartyl/asparaginyl beta-hydroxylase domain-containing protein [Arenimonas sp.]|uniref:aspartyl/asparaginyl beta-hydroxylase domain-containing protein n=1 Tax=Arenimonas sp. TaxID=1872635 RepID=UPI002C536A37|nr:aspartyl/asparaginyl beta-hydroxylase domain-containing protein [Arenimonas sp.]HMB56106.1 aspartyl/asparaginyl beta-hydroxylase domain-containing protein [Arenimonas sp.]